MEKWIFQHSVFTIADRPLAWAWWSDMDNLAALEPGIDRIELDGPFTTGTTGRTITADERRKWTLTEVIPEKRCVITGTTADGEGTLQFEWTFEEEADGTRMTQTITATGSIVEEHEDQLQQMVKGTPSAMATIADRLDRLAQEEA